MKEKYAAIAEKNHIEAECRGKRKDLEASKKLGKPVMSNRICYECKGYGYLAKDCPRRREQSNNLKFLDCFSFNVQHNEMIGDTDNTFNNFLDIFFEEEECYEVTPKQNNLHPRDEGRTGIGGEQ